MPHHWWIRRMIVVAAAMAALSGAIVLAGSAPEPVASATLGPEWQCSRLIFVFTSCSRVRHTQSVRVRVTKIPVCARARTA
jgi:hypothetical protein